MSSVARLCSFTLRQVRERTPERYGDSASLTISPSHPSRSAWARTRVPSPVVNRPSRRRSLVRTWSRCSSRARLAASGRGRRSSGPTRRMSKTTSAVGIVPVRASISLAPFRCIRDCRAVNEVGRPRPSRATISPSRITGPPSVPARSRNALTTSGNCAALSLPFREYRATRATGWAGSTTTMARMPSNFCSYTSDELDSGTASNSQGVASMGAGGAVSRQSWTVRAMRRNHRSVNGR